MSLRSMEPSLVRSLWPGDRCRSTSMSLWRAGNSGLVVRRPTRIIGLAPVRSVLVAR